MGGDDTHADSKARDGLPGRDRDFNSKEDQ
jgi:hypothetical protein